MWPFVSERVRASICDMNASVMVHYCQCTLLLNAPPGHMSEMSKLEMVHHLRIHKRMVNSSDSEDTEISLTIGFMGTYDLHDTRASLASELISSTLIKEAYLIEHNWKP